MVDGPPEHFITEEEAPVDDGSDADAADGSACHFSLEEVGVDAVMFVDDESVSPSWVFEFEDGREEAGFDVFFAGASCFDEFIGGRVVEHDLRDAFVGPVDFIAVDGSVIDDDESVFSVDFSSCDFDLVGVASVPDGFAELPEEESPSVGVFDDSFEFASDGGLNGVSLVFWFQVEFEFGQLQVSFVEASHCECVSSHSQG